MAWTTPKTWAAGNTLTAADMNTYVRDNSAELKTLVDGKIPLPGSPSDGEVLTYDSGTSAWVAESLPAVAAGKILQVVSATKTNTFTTASTSFVDITDLSVTLTPATTGSKVLLLGFVTNRTLYNNQGAFFQFLRGATAIAIGNAASSRTRATAGWQGGDQVTGGMTMTWVDSPNTTSSTTYKIQMRSSDGNNAQVGATTDDANLSTRARTVCSLVALEIGA